MTAFPGERDVLARKRVWVFSCDRCSVELLEPSETMRQPWAPPLGWGVWGFVRDGEQVMLHFCPNCLGRAAKVIDVLCSMGAKV